MRIRLILIGAIVALASARSAYASNITPYYIFDGDAQRGFEITNGIITNTFSTFGIAYPVAIRSTIWLGDRDDRAAREFTLAGVATGNTSVGGAGFSQLLDGATGNGANYGIECCDSTNSVTVANTNWTNQHVLFNLPGNAQGLGIAFDPADSTLWVSTFNSSSITHFGLNGAVLGVIGVDQQLTALAYESLTDSFWGFNRGTQNLVQFNRAGGILSSTHIGNLGNVFAGEMPVVGTTAAPVPEPATLALLGMGLAPIVRAARRRRT